MTTYSKETALYDTGAISGDIENVQTNLEATDDKIDLYRDETNQALNDINESIYGDGTGTDDSIQGLLSRATANIASLSSQYSVIVGNLDSFFEFRTAGSTPLLVIGAANSDFKLNITNEALQFLYGDNLIAYMTGTALRIKDQLSFGNFIMYQRNNGHFTLKKIDD